MLSCLFVESEPQVQPELQEFECYVHDALGATVKTAPWRGAGNLPHVLRERYKFAQAELLGLRVLLVIDSNPEEQPPASVSLLSWMVCRIPIVNRGWKSA
jgi:hypothetical protein